MRKSTRALILVISLVTGNSFAQQECPIACFYPVVSAVNEAYNLSIGVYPADNVIWTVQTDRARFFFGKFYQQFNQSLTFLSKDELRAYAADNAEAINLYLEKDKLNIRLEDVGPGLYIASILKFFLQWNKTGKACSLRDLNGKDFPAVMLDNLGAAGWVYANEKCLGLEGEMLFAISVGQRDFVFIATSDLPPADQFDLLDKIRGYNEKIKKGLSRYGGFYSDNYYDYASITLPMLSVNRIEYLDWLKGVAADRGYPILQAKQQIEFTLDENGIGLKSGVALYRSRGLVIQKDYVVNRPFYIWIQRGDGPVSCLCNAPLFAMYATKACWKRPY